MKKNIFTTLVLVLLVMAGCSRSESTPTDSATPNDSANTTQDADDPKQDVTFDQTDNSVYTPSGELLINLTWLNDVGKLNASVTLSKMAVTSEDDFEAYVIGEAYEIQDFFGDVQDLISWYKSDGKNENSERGGFELYGDWWNISDLKIEDLEMEMQQTEFYYVFRFFRGTSGSNQKGPKSWVPFELKCLCV